MGGQVIRNNITTTAYVSSDASLLGPSLLDGANSVIDSIGLAWADIKSLLSTMGGVALTDAPDFNTLMYGYMYRLMWINNVCKTRTLTNVGDAAYPSGDGDFITEQAMAPDYIVPTDNYLLYARNAKVEELGGYNTTREKGDIKVYSEPNNLYPDELDLLNVSTAPGGNPVWKFENSGRQDSLLYKTKRLFQQRKINSLISRFGTRADESSGHIEGPGDGETKYGLSRGRNLLTRDAERSGGRKKYLQNGYSDPYCRVWTHHHDYGTFKDVMRPITITDESGNTSVVKLADYHNWPGYTSKDGEWTWKHGNKGWEYSVLDKDTTILNIAPKYVNGAGSNVHTRQCMFSIENLAWKGYNPYSFESALSWEQRGPMGGRIMWFPPYGIQITESTSTEWNPHKFIGRGEEVYTYINTKRTGTLRFILLTDHPSIVDYVTANPASYAEVDGKKNVEDTDWYRFFAGCDPIDGSSGPGGGKPFSMLQYAKPTELTDEYVEGDLVMTEETREAIVDESEPEAYNGPEREIVFYTFFPNNYSGVFDSESTSGVDPIAYLLYGKGAQMDYDSSIATGSDSPEDKASELSLHLGFDSDDLGNSGNGFEMNSSSIVESGSGSTNYIVKYKYGTWPSEEKTWDSTCGLEGTRTYYRMDGRYYVEKNKNSNGEFSDNGLKNTYQQVLPSNHRTYSISNKLNSDASKVKSQMGEEGEVYSLSEIAAAVLTMEDKTPAVEKIKSVLGSDYNSDRVGTLIELFKNGVTSVETNGYASVHGSNASANVNTSRNRLLALNRARSVNTFLRIHCELDANILKSPDTIDTPNPNGDRDAATFGLGIDDINIVSQRYAKTVIKFKSSETVNISTPEAQTTDENGDNVSYVGMEKIEGKEGFYRDEQGQIWELQGNVFVRYAPSYKARFDSTGRLIESGNGVRTGDEPDTNRFRYDQEYHFFKKFAVEHEFQFKQFTEKVQYFDPAFHSMSPEGFNARLTFLNQCMRQGSTITMSDRNAKTAANLAFGRPPYCVLRLGDFYNQMIVIDNVTISYDVSGGLVWDLNPEGTGVQPMLAEVNVSFTFIGGGDITGPVKRLQNAATFNYYANASLYDNRADRMVYEDYNSLGKGGKAEYGILKRGDDTSSGANTYFHNVDQYNKKS